MLKKISGFLIYRDKKKELVALLLNSSGFTSNTDSNPPDPSMGTTHLALLATKKLLSPGTVLSSFLMFSMCVLLCRVLHFKCLNLQSRTPEDKIKKNLSENFTILWAVEASGLLYKVILLNWFYVRRICSLLPATFCTWLRESTCFTHFTNSCNTWENSGGDLSLYFLSMLRLCLVLVCDVIANGLRSFLFICAVVNWTLIGWLGTCVRNTVWWGISDNYLRFRFLKSMNTVKLFVNVSVWNIPLNKIFVHCQRTNLKLGQFFFFLIKFLNKNRNVSGQT